MIGKLSSGEIVYNRHNNHNHVTDQSLLKFALSTINSNNRRFIETEVAFKHDIGFTICIDTSQIPDSEIIYRVRRGRKFPSRIIMGRDPLPCSTMAIVLKWDYQKNAYILITAFVGHITGPEELDPNATEESKRFWQTHALICSENDLEEI